MSNIRGRDISISGDGNAVGDNNRLTVVKHEKHHHHHQSSSSRSGAGGSSEEVAPLVFGLGFLMIAACVVGSYLFALHASVVYIVLHLLLGAELVAAAVMLYQGFDEDGVLDPKLIVMLVLSMLASGVLLAVHASYQEDLTTIAQAASSAKQFWCSMNDYGRELALLHAVTGVFGFGAGSLFLALPTAAMLAERFLGFGVEGLARTLSERLSSWVTIVFSAILLMGASYLHTGDGWKTWSNVVGSPPAFFCKGVPVVGAR